VTRAGAVIVVPEGLHLAQAESEGRWRAVIVGAGGGRGAGAEAGAGRQAARDAAVVPERTR
jgi:predicted secreted protein